MDNKNNPYLEALAKAAFASWNQALLSRDPKNVAALYEEDASFLPTMNPEFKHGRAGAEAYFTHFLEQYPSGKVVEEAVQEISRNAADQISAFLHSGLYDFEVSPEGKRETVAARFTFLWRLDADGNWLIAHHHSSVKPRG